MRVAKTIQDVSELLADYEVSVCLMDDNAIEFLFPETKKETEYKETSNQYRIDNFSHIPKTDPIHFTRKTRYVVRGLVESPRFWRLTTVADQLGRFCLFNNKQDKLPFGTIKARKKAKENFKLMFENLKYAKKFMKKLEKTKLFEKALA